MTEQTTTVTGQPKPQQPKPAPKKEQGPTATDRKRIVAEELIKVGAALAKDWDAKQTGVPVGFAREMIASYLSYTPGSFWLAPLPVPTTGRGSKHTLQ